MLTSLDIKKLQSVFATKDDLKKFATKNDLKMLATKFATKKEITSGFDELMLELKAIREELVVGAHRRSENSKLLENHENRISFVESKLSF